MSPFWILLKQDDGGGDDNWSYKTCNASAKLSPLANHYPVFYRPDALPVTQPKVSKHEKWQAVVSTTRTNFDNFWQVASANLQN